uniref:DUF1985 domain-containing protein n=1 Tax=Cannabis sativa TaxID=3483 RepID=A0A803NSI9_CANSA
MLFGTIKDDDDAIKIAKVFTVTNILESKRGSTAVDELIMKLVDDEEDFDKYPWGRRSFDETIKGLISAQECDKKGYELCGFPLAFQVWGFEVIPLLGESFATRVGRRIPRLLNWKLLKNP